MLEWRIAAACIFDIGAHYRVLWPVARMGTLKTAG
jgi:hypothetical protein